jgi:hypothetical protein
MGMRGSMGLGTSLAWCDAMKRRGCIRGLTGLLVESGCVDVLFRKRNSLGTHGWMGLGLGLVAER